MHSEKVYIAPCPRYCVLMVMQKFGAFWLCYSDALGWGICSKIMNHIKNWPCEVRSSKTTNYWASCWGFDKISFLGRKCLCLKKESHWKCVWCVIPCRRALWELQHSYTTFFDPSTGWPAKCKINSEPWRWEMSKVSKRHPSMLPRLSMVRQCLKSLFWTPLSHFDQPSKFRKCPWSSMSNIHQLHPNTACTNLEEPSKLRQRPEPINLPKYRMLSHFEAFAKLVTTATEQTKELQELQRYGTSEGLARSKCIVNRTSGYVHVIRLYPTTTAECHSDMYYKQNSQINRTALTRK